MAVFTVLRAYDMLNGSLRFGMLGGPGETYVGTMDVNFYQTTYQFEDISFENIDGETFLSGTLIGVQQAAGWGLPLEISDFSIELFGFRDELELNRSSGLISLQPEIFQSNDELRGSDFADRLVGYNGDDTIDGGGGEDVASYFGHQNGYTLTLYPTFPFNQRSATLEDRRTDGDGTDNLENIEVLEFDASGQSIQFDLESAFAIAGLSGASLETFIELYIAGISIFDRFRGHAAFLMA